MSEIEFHPIAVKRKALELSEEVSSQSADQPSTGHLFTTRRPRHPALFIRGVGGGKEPESSGYRSLSSPKIWDVPGKNKVANGASLRNELIEQGFRVF